MNAATDHEDPDRDLAGAYDALCRGIRKALRLAKFNGLQVPVWRDGKVVHVEPEELERLMDEGEAPA